MSKKLIGCLFGLLLVIANTVGADTAKSVRGFADINFSVDKNGRSHFGLGQYDTYLTGQVADHVSYLSEVVIAYLKAPWLMHIPTQRVCLFLCQKRSIN
jgi:hypothetical protein